MLLDRIDHLAPQLISRAAMNGFKMDSSNFDAAQPTIFLKRQLLHVEQRVYRRKYSKLVYRQLFPVQTDGGRGPKNFAYNFMDYKGEAKFMEPGKSGDLPTVSLTQDEVIGKYRSFGTSFEYSWDELDAAQYAGFALQSELGMAAREVFERLANTTTHKGNAALKLDGFLVDLSRFTAATVSTSGTGSTDAEKRLWKNKSSQVIFQEFMAGLLGSHTATDMAFTANYCTLPVEQFTLLIQRAMSEYDTRSILQAVKEAAEKAGIDLTIVPNSEMKGADNGKDVAMFYPYDEEVAAIKIPMPFTMFPMVPTKDGNFSVPCWGRTGGMVIKHPKAFTYLTGI